MELTGVSWSGIGQIDEWEMIWDDEELVGKMGKWIGAQ